MNPILFVTTNEYKFSKAMSNLRQQGIALTHEFLEMKEIQSSSGEEIVRDKAKQAYEHFKQPIVVNDDTWSIPALRGFPSTGMKLCNDFLIADDWLRLMHGIDDRRINLHSYYAYHDGQTIQTIVGKEEKYFLSESRGNYQKSPCLQVIAKIGSTTSIAEEIAVDTGAENENPEFWVKLSNLLKGN